MPKNFGMVCSAGDRTEGTYKESSQKETHRRVGSKFKSGVIETFCMEEKIQVFQQRKPIFFSQYAH